MARATLEKRHLGPRDSRQRRKPTAQATYTHATERRSADRLGGGASAVVLLLLLVGPRDSRRRSRSQQGVQVAQPPTPRSPCTLAPLGRDGGLQVEVWCGLAGPSCSEPENRASSTSSEVTSGVWSGANSRYSTCPPSAGTVVIRRPPVASFPVSSAVSGTRGPRGRVRSTGRQLAAAVPHVSRTPVPGPSVQQATGQEHLCCGPRQVEPSIIPASSSCRCHIPPAPGPRCP